MAPDEEVQITVTRGEAVRMWGALHALCEVQKMLPGSPMAMALSDAVEDIEKILPRLAQVFPEEIRDHIAAEDAKAATQMKADTKTYAEGPSVEPVAFDVPVSSLEGLSPEEAVVIFATEYDDAIRGLVRSLIEFTDFTDEDYERVLGEEKALLEATVPIPKNLTVSQSKPYVAVSDLVTLGGLAYEMYKRQDQIEDRTKPF